MKRYFYIALIMISAIFTTSCSRVAPNYAGVLMENWGKDGKDDFSICVDELTSVDLTGRLYDFDVSEETAMWWQSGRTPFTDIKDLYEDIDEWKQNLIKIAEGMPY